MKLNKKCRYYSYIKTSANCFDIFTSYAVSFYQFIKSNSPDVYKAIIWLNQNMHLFQGRVYKPMIVEVNMNNL